MYCARDQAIYWINNMYYTGILIHINRSQIHWRAHRRDIMNRNMWTWTNVLLARYILLDSSKRYWFINTSCSNSHEWFWSGNMYCSLKGVYIEAFNMHCGMTAQNIEWKVSYYLLYCPKCENLQGREMKVFPNIHFDKMYSLKVCCTFFFVFHCRWPWQGFSVSVFLSLFTAASYRRHIYPVKYTRSSWKMTSI